VVMVAFGPWVPDQTHLEGALSEARDVLPYADHYRALPTAIGATDAVPGGVVGAFSSRLVAGASKTYAGALDDIYERAGASWSSVGDSGGYSLTAGDHRWEFTQYGTDVYAASLGATLQRQTNASGDFADVSGGPVAACIANVRQFVVVGDVDESGSIPHKVRWCAIDDPTDWVPSEATQAGSQELDARDGRVMAITGGEFGLVLQQHAVSRMVYIGAPIVWQFDKIDSRNGCEVSGSVVQVGREVYYLSHDGWRMTDGSGQSVNIGDGVVNKWFRAQLNTSSKDKMTGAYNPDWRCIVWSFPRAGSSNDTLLIYHPGSKRWAYGTYGSDHLFEGASSSVTLEGLDAYNTNLDELEPSLDDSFWIGGEFKFLGLSGGVLETYDGEPTTARIETNEYQVLPGKKARIQAVEPLIDGSAVVSIGHRELPTDAVAYTATAAVNPRTGRANFQHVSRWQRVRFDITGSFAEAEGFNVLAKPAGVV
jgi:hypothetical protein